MNRVITTVICLLFGLAQAQISQPFRWEKEFEFHDEYYSVISLKRDGLALIRDLEKYNSGKKKWELIILDTSLQLKWTKELELKGDFEFLGYEYVNGRLNLMFRRSNVNNLDAEVLWVNLETQEISTSSIDVNLQVRLTHYTVAEQNCVFGGYVNREPVLMIHDPVKNSSIIVQGFFLTDTELMDVRPNSNNTFNILLFQRTPTKKKIIFRTIDGGGNILIEDEIPIADDRTILSAATSVLEHDEVLIGGTYTYKNEKQAIGIFNCLIDPFSEQTVQFTEFPQLHHFLDYLPEKRADKVRGKALEKSKKSGSFHSNVNIHRIEEFSGGFALFGETYNSSSASSFSSYPASAYSRPYTPYYYSPFASRYYNNPYLYPTAPAVEEMRMLQSFVIGYDFKGRRIWDYSIPMNEIKVPGRNQVSDFTMVRNVPNFIYKDDVDLKYSYHSIDTSRIQEPNSVSIKLLSDSEEAKPKEEHDGYVRHWYGNFLYVWGVQTIKPKSGMTLLSNKRVFFINKIQVE